MGRDKIQSGENLELMHSILYLTLYWVPGTPTPYGVVCKGAVPSEHSNACNDTRTLSKYLYRTADYSSEYINRAKANDILYY